MSVQQIQHISDTVQGIDTGTVPDRAKNSVDLAGLQEGNMKEIFAEIKHICTF